MLPFENMVSDYVKETGNHVLYRVTPVFEGKNLVASGVYMEAYSVEDDGDGICFYVYVFNRQPGVKIDYLTGDALRTVLWNPLREKRSSAEKEETKTYVLNISNGKFHLPDCDSVKKMKEENKQIMKCKRSN